MALDAVEIYIYNVKENEQKVFCNSLGSWNIRENRKNKYLSAYEYYTDGIYVRYRPRYEKGTLSIKFNVAKFMTGDNISSVFCFNTNNLQMELQSKLYNIINFRQLSHIRFWKVSHFENNINIIRDTSEIDSLYDFIYNNRHNILPRFNCEANHSDGGRTITFFNANNKSNGTIVIKFYYKLSEIENKPSKSESILSRFDMIRHYKEKSLINIRMGQDILRMEITMYRDKIFERFKPQIQYSSLSIDINQEQDTKTIQQQIGTFEEVINYRYQILMLKRVINMFHLDKRITTKNKLFTFIDNNFKDKEKRTTAKAVINSLNSKDKYHKKKPSPTTINKYKNFILDSGYHYLYNESEIQPVIIEDIIAQLPQVQQEAIRIYKNSNIYYDAWY